MNMSMPMHLKLTSNCMNQESNQIHTYHEDFCGLVFKSLLPSLNTLISRLDSSFTNEIICKANNDPKDENCTIFDLEKYCKDRSIDYIKLNNYTIKIIIPKK